MALKFVWKHPGKAFNTNLTCLLGAGFIVIRHSCSRHASQRRGFESRWRKNERKEAKEAQKALQQSTRVATSRVRVLTLQKWTNNLSVLITAWRSSPLFAGTRTRGRWRRTRGRRWPRTCRRCSASGSWWPGRAWRSGSSGRDSTDTCRKTSAGIRPGQPAKKIGTCHKFGSGSIFKQAGFSSLARSSAWFVLKAEAGNPYLGVRSARLYPLSCGGFSSAAQWSGVGAAWRCSSSVPFVIKDR